MDNWIANDNQRPFFRSWAGLIGIALGTLAGIIFTLALML